MLLSPDVGYRRSDRRIRIECGFLHTGEQWKGGPEGRMYYERYEGDDERNDGFIQSTAMRHKWGG